MELTQAVALGSFVLAIPQGIIGLAQLFSWNKQKKSGNALTLSKNPTIQATILMLAAFLMVFSGFWLWYHPLKATIIEKPVTIEKQIPCPIIQQKNGPATARGKIAIAHSGNNDTNTVAPPQASPSTPP
jgi:hypothetical protein